MTGRKEELEGLYGRLHQYRILRTVYGGGDSDANLSLREGGRGTYCYAQSGRILVLYGQFFGLPFEEHTGYKSR